MDKETKKRFLRRVPRTTTYPIPREISYIIRNYLEPKLPGLYSAGVFNSDKAEVIHRQETLSKYYSALVNGYEEAELYEDIYDIAAYLLFYFYKYLPRIHYILYDIIKYTIRPIFPREYLKILDLGCGPGTFGVGFTEYVKQLKNSKIIDGLSLEIDSVESNELFIDAFKFITSAYQNLPGNDFVKFNNPLNLTLLSPFNELLRSELINHYDFVITGNLMVESNINTGDIPLACSNLLKLCHDYGFLIITEPGGQRPGKILANFINSNRDRVISPCLRTWKKLEKCTDACWSTRGRVIPNEPIFKSYFLGGKIPSYAYAAFQKVPAEVVARKHERCIPIRDLPLKSSDERVSFLGKIRGNFPRYGELHIWLCDSTGMCKIQVEGDNPKYEEFRDLLQGSIYEILNAKCSGKRFKGFPLIMVDHATDIDPWDFVYAREEQAREE